MCYFFAVGQKPIRCYFPGEGHTSDNIVVWLPNQQILYGGCPIKSVAVFGMGNLADANLSQWAGSIKNLLREFGTATIVIPGHEEWGDIQSLKHTLNLVETYNKGQK